MDKKVGKLTASQISDFDTEVSNNTSVDANTTHKSSNGSDHTFVDQSVIINASPTFSNVNFTVSTDKNYVTDAEATVLGNTSGTNSGDQNDHGTLDGLGDDDHTQYSLADGTRAFTGVVSGIDPTASNHLATKEYIDMSVSFVDSYFLNDTASNIDGIYHKMLQTPTGESESSFTLSEVGAGNDQAIVNFATDPGIPGVTNLKAGVYMLHIHAEKTAGNRDFQLYFELHSRTSGDSETLRATSEISDVITDKVSLELHAVISSDIDILDTDRLVLKMFANITGGSQLTTVILYTEGTVNSRFDIPTTTEVLSSIFIRQDGTKPLTADWDVGSYTITADTFIGDLTGNADTVTNGTLTTALTVDTGTVDLIGNVANNSVLTLGAGASSVSGANTGDQDISGISTNTGDITNIETKTDFITVTQNVDLDSMESDISTNTAKDTNATHTGEVTGATTLTVADNIIDEANLKLDSEPTNDYVLTADSGESGGMKWSEATGGFSNPMTTRGDVIIRNSSNVTDRLGVGGNTQVLTSDGTDITWEDAGGGVAGDMPTVRLRSAAGQSANSTSDVAVQWDTSDFKDATTFTHNTVTNNSRIEVEDTGKYLVSGVINVSGTTSNYRLTNRASIRIDGSTTLANFFDATYVRVTTGSNNAGVQFSIILDLTANQYFEIMIKRLSTTSGDGTVTSGTNISVVRLSGEKGDTGATGASGNMDNLVDDTTPQLGGNLDWNSNGTMLVGQTVGGSNDDLVYLSSANTWSQVDADAEATCKGMLGIRISASTVLTHGIYTTSGLTTASIYYASTTLGGITLTAPSGSGDIVRIIGYALSTTEFFFDPDKTYIEVT